MYLMDLHYEDSFESLAGDRSINDTDV